ncbi:MAG: SLAC1 anion channel family protein [Thiotrichales bacterium]
METSPLPAAEPGRRLEHFPISFFAMIMGLAGLAIAWEKAQQVTGLELYVTPWLAGFVALMFVLLASIYALKWVRYSAAVVAEFRHPIKLNFFPAISISLLLLAVALMPFGTGVSRWLWASGATLHLGFTLHVVNAWIHQQHFELHHMNPAWFIPAVGNVLVPLAGVSLGQFEISWFFFSVGLAFWLILLTILFYRVMFHHPLPDKLLPTLFILIAPPAVGFVAYLRLVGELDAFGRVLYFVALFFTLLLFVQLGRFLKLRFFLSWWAYSFPLAAISIASFVMHEQTTIAAYFYLGWGLLLALTAVIALLLVRTVGAVRKHGICLPE